MLAFAAGCLAAANPRKPEEGGSEVRKGIDVVIALDVSNSMMGTDVKPSRLDKAKAFISQLLKAMPDNRVGLVLFAGQAYVQMPLTFDHSAASLFVSAANPGIIATQGTALNDALQKSDLAFAATSDRYKAIILISDGETHDDNAVITAQQVGARGIMVNTVGIGSPEGSVIADPLTGEPKKDESGNVVISRLNEQALQQVAAAANGTYIHLTEEGEAVKQIGIQLAVAEKKALVDTSLLNYSTLFMWFAAPMLLLLLAELFFPDRKKGDK